MGMWTKRESLVSVGAERENRSRGSELEDQLWRLMYASAAKPDITAEELDMILSSSRRHNEMLDVTGLLMLVNSTFLQVIEGGFENVHGVFDRIKVDRRHKRVRLLQSRPITERSFPDWTMSPPSRTLREFADARDIDEFFKGIRPPFFLNDEDLQRVLERFHTGEFVQTERWSS